MLRQAYAEGWSRDQIQTAWEALPGKPGCTYRAISGAAGKLKIKRTVPIARKPPATRAPTEREELLRVAVAEGWPWPRIEAAWHALPGKSGQTRKAIEGVMKRLGLRRRAQAVPVPRAAPKPVERAPVPVVPITNREFVRLPMGRINQILAAKGFDMSMRGLQRYNERHRPMLFADDSTVSRRAVVR